MLRTLGVLVATAVVAVSTASPAIDRLSAQPPGATHEAAATHRLEVTGFQEEGDPDSAITASRRALRTVGLDGVNLSADGSTVTTPDAGARKVLSLAHSEHLRAEFLIGNWDNHINDFSEAFAHHLLGSSTHIKAVAASLVRSAKAQGWDGISVDLESLHSRDRPGLVTFLATLRAGLPVEKSLSVCVTNYTSPGEYRANGYDLAGIGRSVNQVVLMTYDQHGPWENTPGPVGALAWQRQGLGVVVKAIPAAKVDLGVAGYGYAWRPHSNDMLTDAQARALVARDHGTKHFDTHVGEWVGHLPDGSTLWWSDARSYALRVTLAQHHKLHGLAVWDLGSSDRLT